MQKEIGSNFDLKVSDYTKHKRQIHMCDYGIFGVDEAFFSKGRDAEKCVLETIIKNTSDMKMIALIPPFTCHTVIQPFLDLGFEVKAYSVDNNLCIDAEQFYREIVDSKAEVVLFHRYFGFDTVGNLNEIIQRARNQGVIFIEDLTQCLYSDFPKSDVDYYVGSFRKWAALPDGGFAVSAKTKLWTKPDEYDAQLMEKKLDALNLKYEYLHENKGEKQIFLNEFREAEDLLENEEKYYLMTPVSVYVQFELDVKELQKKRRENYRYLNSKLMEITKVRVITPKIEEKASPLYLAISTPMREQLQDALRKENIYAPIVWPQAECCPKICDEAQHIYDTVLCIPVDQRYGLDDMDRIVKNIKGFFMSEIKQLNIEEIIKYKDKLIQFILESNQNAAHMNSYTIEDAEQKYNQLLVYMEQKTAIIVGAVDSDELRGFIWAYHFPFRDDKNRIYVSILHVGEDYRNQHLGEYLLDKVEEIAHHLGYSTVFLHTEAENHGAIRFYNRMGFKSERVQLVKKLTDAQEFSWGGGVSLKPEQITKYKESLARLLYINTHAHFDSESYSMKDAYVQIDDVREYLELDKAIVIALLDDEVMKGFIWVFPYEYYKKPCYLLQAVSVYEVYRNQGIAQKLFYCVEKAITTKGINDLYIWVDVENIPAMHFYKKQGMAEVGYQLMKCI